MSTLTRRIPTLVGIAAVAALALTGCAPGSGPAETDASLGPVSKDVGSDPITLTVWDQNTEGAINDTQDQLNAAFEEKYPNVTIDRVSRSFADLKTTLRLALSSDTPPDVVQANQGYPDMGSFVSGGYLRPVDDYSELYGWDSYYPEQLLELNSFSADGTTWQGDNLYGVSQTGELVGVYYNKKILSDLGLEAPTDLAGLEDAFAAAQYAGVVPMSYGDVEKSPGIHLFGVVQAAVAGEKAVNDLVTGTSGAWTDDVNVETAETLADWSEKGYIPEGANGISRDDALGEFADGKSAFLITGTWQLGTLEEALGTDVGFTALNPVDGDTPVTTGGEGLAWAITSKSENTDAAAAYVNFITDTSASEILVETGNLPTVIPDSYTPEDGTLTADIVEQYRAISDSNGLVPYLDYATPTFYDTLANGVQELTAGQQDAKAFTEGLQADYSAFLESK